MGKYIKLCVLFILLSSVNCTYAFQNYSFKHYNINNGLSQNTVHSIFQDSHGFMWFGTKDGLNRFDGTTFKVFKFSPNDNLKDNVFHRIIEDKKGNLWVATEGGIYVFNPYLEVFDKFVAETDDNVKLEGWISDLIQDNDGDIWITVEEKGAFHYKVLEDKLIFYPISFKSEGMRMISACAGSNNDVWVFPHGLSPIKIDKESGQTSKLHLIDDPQLFDKIGEITNVIFDGNNQLILPTSLSGVISINTLNRTHKVLLDTDSYGNNVFARTVTRIDNNNIWVGTESGIYILNALEGSVFNLRHSPSIPTSLSDNAIYSIYGDSDGGVWVGSFFGGVDYYSEHLNKFELFYPIQGINNMNGYRVREFCSDNNGRIWIGTEDNGLHLFDPKTKRFLALPQELNNLYSNIHALFNDGDNLWISTFSKGLNRYNLNTKELSTYINTSDPNSISQNSAFSVIKDSRGVLWIGTLLGLNIYNYEDDNFIRVEELKGISIQDVFEDSLGRIWVSTFSQGLYRYDSLSNSWTLFINDPDDPLSLPYNKITSVYQDSRSRIWITTQGGGFSQYIEENNTFITTNSIVGMPNDVVYQMVEDDDQNLWLSTNYGLVCYNPQTKLIRSYTVDNGLKTNQFNYHSSFKSDDGYIYFGSLDGFIRFNPSNLNEIDQEYPILLTGLSINNIKIKPIENASILPQSIMFSKKLTLPYNRNSLEFEYALINFSNQSENQVVYKLDGFDKDWINARGNRSIIYSNLSPGKYKLNIKQMGDFDNKNVRTLSVVITPPFWLSVWAYVLYILLVLLLVFIFIRYFKIRESDRHKREMLEFEKEKERELYRSKIDFFTNVAHEIRTPLSLIKAPLDYVLMSEVVSNEVKDSLMIMSKNTDRLLNLTNQLLDFQKTEAEAYSLNIKTENVSDLIRETCFRFSSFAQQRNVEFSLNLPEDDIYVQLDKESFLKIISNLMSNAIKYCDGKVDIEAHVSDIEGEKYMQFYIENDGDVIGEDIRVNIFEPFFHINSQKNNSVSGTGIGLALSRSIAELHKGTLVFEEKEGLNSFHLSIPIGEVITSTEDIKEEALSNTIKTKVENTTRNNKFNILLVDDDIDLLKFEEKVLRAHFNVYIAENGADALDILKEVNINLIVSDVMMPEMDGFELTRNIRSDVEYSHIPIILLTAKTNVQSKVEGFDIGADSYVEKPFSIDVLIAQITSLLKGREKLRETFHRQPFIGANSVALTKSDEEFIKNMNAIIEKNIANTEFVVEDIAEHFNMSRASFYRKIKGVLDLTPNEYIRIERLKKAAHLLNGREYKVNEVCYMVGFNSPSYFAKCFQKQFGVLPKDF